MQYKSCLECAVILPAVLKEQKTLKTELSAVEAEKALLKTENGILNVELNKCAKQSGKERKQKIGLGIGLGIVGGAAAIGGFFLGKNVK